MSSDAVSRRSRPDFYKSRPNSMKRLEKADRKKVIRPSNSRFKSLLDYRTYFVIRRDLSQAVKDVFINGLSEIIQSPVRVLKGQFPKRTLADTISDTQMYWDGTNKLRLSLKLPRLQTTKVVYASPVPTRHPNVDRPFPVTQPRARSRSPPPKESPQARTDFCYYCNKPGHFAAQCAEPYRPRERRSPVISMNSVTEDTKTTAESNSNESTDSKNE